jgi:diguanylate cyclase (GGDEF)-like protein
LPNRWLFRYQLELDIARAARSGRSIAVLFLDLDNFKNINDSYGHPAGDALLAQVGSRIQETLRENDMLARLGGDEFCISLCDLASPQDALYVANSILVRLQAVFCIAGHDVYSGASVGLAFYPDDALDSDTLLRYADMAMYQAKQGGRGAYVCYSEEMDVRAREDRLLHTQLKEALALGQLEMHYQPQVDVRTGQVVGAEALLRARDPAMGGVAPSRLIAIAEAKGLMLELSEYVLAMACRDIARWNNGGTPLRVSVNFSAQQFRQGSLVATIQAALALAGAPAHLLCVEITESVAMAHPEEARRQIWRLREMGCAISLDDFGTGYSSLAYLKSLPITELKVDRSFIHGIPRDHYGMAIVQTIITLAHSIGISLVAEGVENEEQLAFLRMHGCEHYQGWLFAPALAPAELQTLLMRGGAEAPARAPA